MYTDSVPFSPSLTRGHTSPLQGPPVAMPFALDLLATEQEGRLSWTKKRHARRNPTRWLMTQRVRWATQNNQTGITHNHNDGCHQIYIQANDELRAYSEEEFSLFMHCNGAEVRYTPQTLFSNAHIMEHLVAGKPQGPQLPENHQPPLFLEEVDRQVGWGAFALRNIEEGEIIGRYTGVICETEQGNAYSLVCPLLDETFIIDATCFGNETRYINHSDNPNCIFVPARTEKGIPEMLLVATSSITKGQQVLTDYGDHYWYGVSPKKL